VQFPCAKEMRGKVELIQDDDIDKMFKLAVAASSSAMVVGQRSQKQNNNSPVQEVKLMKSRSVRFHFFSRQSFALVQRQHSRASSTRSLPSDRRAYSSCHHSVVERWHQELVVDVDLAAEVTSSFM